MVQLCPKSFFVHMFEINSAFLKSMNNETSNISSHCSFKLPNFDLLEMVNSITVRGVHSAFFHPRLKKTFLTIISTIYDVLLSTTHQCGNVQSDMRWLCRQNKEQPLTVLFNNSLRHISKPSCLRIEKEVQRALVLLADINCLKDAWIGFLVVFFFCFVF